MRLWVKDSERRPDPAPLKADDRMAISVGMLLWAVALVVMLLTQDALEGSGREWWLWTAVAGLVIGAIAFLYTRLKRPRD